MQDKTLILGAAGFIGTDLTLRLIGQNKNLILFEQTGSDCTARKYRAQSRCR